MRLQPGLFKVADFGPKPRSGARRSSIGAARPLRRAWRPRTGRTASWTVGTRVATAARSLPRQRTCAGWSADRAARGVYAAFAFLGCQTVDLSLWPDTFLHLLGCILAQLSRVFICNYIFSFLIVYLSSIRLLVFSRMAVKFSLQTHHSMIYFLTFSFPSSSRLFGFSFSTTRLSRIHSSFSPGLVRILCACVFFAQTC